LTLLRNFRHSVRLVSPDVNTPDFSQLWLAVDWQRQLDDPECLAFMARLYLLALKPDEQESFVRAQRYLWDD
jgi:hypothetical protein